MIACVCVPVDLVAKRLPSHARRIGLIGRDVGRAYVLSTEIPNHSPLALAMFVESPDGSVTRWFKDDADAVLWAEADARERRRGGS